MYPELSVATEVWQREVWDQQRPEVRFLPWSSFRPSKGTLGGQSEVVGYAARHCKVSREIVVRKRHKFVL